MIQPGAVSRIQDALVAACLAEGIVVQKFELSGVAVARAGPLIDVDIRAEVKR